MRKLGTPSLGSPNLKGLHSSAQPPGRLQAGGVHIWGPIFAPAPVALEVCGAFLVGCRFVIFNKINCFLLPVLYYKGETLWGCARLMNRMEAIPREKEGECTMKRVSLLLAVVLLLSVLPFGGRCRGTQLAFTQQPQDCTAMPGRDTAVFFRPGRGRSCSYLSVAAEKE